MYGVRSPDRSLPITPTASDASGTWIVGPVYAGATLTAVCLPLVVAPPIKSGIVIPRRVISVATVIISSSEGVIRPDSPTRSAPSSVAVSRILWPGTMTPRSVTS